MCDSGVVGNARPCQGRDRGFEPRLSLFSWNKICLCRSGYILAIRSLNNTRKFKIILDLRVPFYAHRHVRNLAACMCLVQ